MNRNPKLKKCDMQKCKGFCCYDGVYITDEEEKRLRKIICNHPDYFNLPVDDYFVNGNWHNRVKGRKTATKNFSYPDNFPKHFSQTKCIFSDSEGLCAFQKLAIKEKKHPWTYKPLACCLFPLIEKNGKLIPPPNKGQTDDYYIDENYPGFVNCLYCGQDCKDGDKWQKTLNDEINWYKQYKQRKIVKIFVEYGLDFDNNPYGLGKSVELEYDDGDEVRTKDKYKVYNRSYYARFWIFKKVFIWSQEKGFQIKSKNRHNFKIVFGYDGDIK